MTGIISARIVVTYMAFLTVLLVVNKLLTMLRITATCICMTPREHFVTSGVYPAPCLKIRKTVNMGSYGTVCNIS